MNTWKRLLVVLSVVGVSLGFGVGSAAAQSVTVCAKANVVVAGTTIVAEDDCVSLP